MSIKRRVNGQWQKSNTLKRYNGSEWQNATTAKRYDGSRWVPLWRESGTFIKYYSPAEYASYRISDGTRLTGVTETNGMPRIIQGSPDGSESSMISTMIFFPLDDITEDLHDAEITRISLESKRLSSAYGTLEGNVILHYGGGYTSCPAGWNGSDKGDADSVSPYYYPDQSINIDLDRIVGEELRDGTATFISFNAIGLPGINYYSEYDASLTRLKIIYRV